MLSKTKIALSAKATGTASGAMAATHHPVHHCAAVESQLSNSAADAYAYSNEGGAERANQPA